MSEIKCPVCQNNLHKINIIVSTCTNDKCKLWGSSIPNLVLEALSQTEWDLVHTRKALDVAVDALKTVKRYLCEMPAPDSATVLRMTCESATTVKKALEQITALEQKDVK